MMLNTPTSMVRRSLCGDFTICPVLNGLWQVSGGHGKIDLSKALSEMREYAKEGYTTFDGADIYGPAEDLMGAFVERYPDQPVEMFTKWVPRPGPMTRQVVEENINNALERMKTTQLDLLQFHWWDYDDERYLDAIKHLKDLQHEGKIRFLGLTNFDTEHMAKIVNSSIPIVSNQVSFSLIDTRPEQKMIPFCQQHNIKLLCYGTLLGGFLSEKYVNVSSEPTSKRELNTISLRKYKRFIDEWGGWTLFQQLTNAQWFGLVVVLVDTTFPWYKQQGISGTFFGALHSLPFLFSQLLSVLKEVADKHEVSISNVAARWVLDKPMVGGIIIGTRLSLSQHRAENQKIFSFELDEKDHQKINSVLSQGNTLAGDCGDEYRD
ncbi:Aldo/keto reductase [Balamuthia mandrillaris]